MRPAVRITGALIFAGVLVGLLWYVRYQRDQPLEEWKPPVRAVDATDPFANRPEMPFRTSAECISCHAAIGEEWRASPHATPWGAKAMLINPRKIECSPCHIPVNIYELGLDKMMQVRAGRHHEGVDCVACHVRGNESLGAGPTREAPCNPRHEPRIGESITCAPCHAFHGTLDEWKGSAFYSQGIGCQECHMPQVVRPMVHGGKPRTGHSHTILGGRDRQLLENCLTIKTWVEGERLKMRITNDLTGHAVPGEINNRRIDLVITTQLSDGAETEWYRQFQAPPRPKRGLVPTTQIMPGEVVEIDRPLPAGEATIRVEMEYRLLFLMPGYVFYRRVVELERVDGKAVVKIREG